MGRAASVLKSFPGEVSERGGRVCVAVPAGTKIAGGVVLGTTPGGGMAFVEPPQARAGRARRARRPAAGAARCPLGEGRAARCRRPPLGLGARGGRPPAPQVFLTGVGSFPSPSRVRPITPRAAGPGPRLNPVPCPSAPPSATSKRSKVVGLNLELIAARAEAMAAEEAVLWDLSGRLMGVLPDAQAVRGPGGAGAQRSARPGACAPLLGKLAGPRVARTVERPSLTLSRAAARMPRARPRRCACAVL
jgi:hypothetical protein